MMIAKLNNSVFHMEAPTLQKLINGLTLCLSMIENFFVI